MALRLVYVGVAAVGIDAVCAFVNAPDFDGAARDRNGEGVAHAAGPAAMSASRVTMKYDLNCLIFLSDARSGRA